MSLWKVLKALSDRHGPLESLNLDELIERAQRQRNALERERIAAGTRALGGVSK